jgi:serine/threonine protein kinase
MREREMFDAALAFADPAARSAYLAEACAGDDRLRRHLEELLAMHQQLGSFLEAPAPALAITVDEQPLREGPGTVLGPYKLLEQIGEGGFGVVFMAEQQPPLRRKVALKVLKPGMDTRQVIARFEAERQALAMMDHPNIARVFDGGETATGRPYFVMELVKGIPITDYCDQSQLTPRERLALFISVCQAVQHAHQKGIIHRDLKPSNVLVTLHDSVPVVKVIDFGIAKALGQQLTDKTLFTGFAQMIGTPLYMSPEQGALIGLDVDTRCDIYALGVLLYELLTGTTPFDKERLKEAGYDELRRIIREEEPPRPSTRLSTLGRAASTVSTHRKSDPKRLSQLCRGDLDWIVMKCLEKDRNRRYETAIALVQDVESYLSDLPVQARPPSAAYRLRKFARRNRVALTMVSLVALALVGIGAAGILAYFNRLGEDQRRADQKDQEERLRAEKRQNALERALMAAMSGDFDGAEKAIDEAELHGASTGQVRMLRGQVAFHRGEEAKAIQHLEQAVHLIPVGEPGAVAARAMLALAYVHSFQNVARFLALSNEVDPLAPITPDDLLFKGLLETWLHPERGLQTLDEGIRRHDSVLARATRLEARAIRAMLTGKVEDAELALEDAQVGQRMLAGNALVLARSVFAHLVAAGIYETEGRPQDSDRILAQARPLVKELEPFAAKSFAAQACFEFYEYVGDEEAAFAISGQGNQFRRAVMLYRRGEFPKALEAAVERSRSGTVGPTEQIERGLILPELPDGPARAQAAFEEIKADPRNTWRVVQPLILLLLGKPEEARQASLQVHREEVMPWGDGLWLTLLDYNCGRITSDQLLQATGQARWKLGSAHFLIGMWRLAEGDRAAAKEHFRKCVATREFYSWHWPWVRAFLARMEEDPAWPTWIGRKK